MRGVSRRRSLPPQRSRAASEYRVTACLLTTTLLVVVACASASATTTRLDGAWGGDQSSFTAGADGATLNLPCASASIARPIVVDARGRFDVDATWITHRSVVPIEGDRKPPKEPVRISGVVRSNELALTVHFTDPNRMNEQFAMTRGRTTRVPLCARARIDNRRSAA